MHPIIFWIIVGIIAGALAKVVVPGEGPGGILGDLIVGVLGAIIGGFMAAVLLGLDISGVETTTLVVAAVGALLLILFERAIPATQVYE